MSRARAKETSTTSGTGATISLDGPENNYQSLVSGVGDGNTDYFAIVEQDGSGWEEVQATVNAGSPDTLEIVEVLDNSNGDTNRINLSGNGAFVFVTLPGDADKARDAINTPGATETLTNKTIDSASNTLTLDLSEGTLTGTKSEFDTACSDGDFAYQQDAAEFTTLDATGQVIFGTASAQAVFGGTTPSFQQLGTDANSAGLLLGRWSNNTGVGQLAALKSRATTIGNHVIVNDGDAIMSLRGYADDGVDYGSEPARIQYFIDGTPGAGDMPGRIDFLTSPSGDNVPVSRVRINSTGDINILNDGKVGGSPGDDPTAEWEVDGRTKTKFLNFGSVDSQTIATGAITVTQSYTRINSEGGAASDDLDTINGTSQGDFIFIRPASNTETIVVKDNADNLRIAGDFTMDSIQDFMLLFNIDGTNLVEMSRSNNQ